MSESAGGLQLDRAEFTDSAAASPCAACAQPLVGAYFEVNALAMCASCCTTLRARLAAGTRVSRAGRAAAAGFAAALGGSIVYWAILALTGIEFGLMAVVVGFAVGKAVRWGSYARGGWFYQTLAIVLTYLAIVSSYVPLIVAEIRDHPPAAQTQAASGQQEAAMQAEAAQEPPTVAQAIVALLIFVGFICAIPFLAGVQNIIGVVIIGFGLYQAWKMNRRATVVITGPHALAAQIRPATA
jgi:hypothetical protein